MMDLVNTKNLILIYLILVNITGFAMMGIDKSRAKRGAWRIPEKTLFLVSALGGSIGTWAGMYFFHHKTKHWYFAVFFPFLALVDIALYSAGMYFL